jgi:hypothetical protein
MYKKKVPGRLISHSVVITSTFKFMFWLLRSSWMLREDVISIVLLLVCMDDVYIITEDAWFPEGTNNSGGTKENLGLSIWSENGIGLQWGGFLLITWTVVRILKYYWQSKMKNLCLVWRTNWLESTQVSGGIPQPTSWNNSIGKKIEWRGSSPVILK